MKRLVAATVTALLLGSALFASVSSADDTVYWWSPANSQCHHFYFQPDVEGSKESALDSCRVYENTQGICEEHSGPTPGMEC